MEIKQRHLDALKAIGACSDRLDAYSAGMDVSKVTFDDAVWVERNAPGLVTDLDVPLWAMVAPGSGYGYGGSNGCGPGYGYGNGSGSGSGGGNGYGYGNNP